MHDSQNKTSVSLQTKLLIQIQSIPSHRSYKGGNPLSNCRIVLSTWMISPHEPMKRLTRVCLHATHAVQFIMTKANDTDVVIIHLFHPLQELGLHRLWIAFGQGSYRRWLPIHDVAATGPERTNGMLFSGCDIVSAFRGRAMLSAWQSWNVCPAVSHVFTQLSS